MREDDIQQAISRLSGDDFERFARTLARRELYPGLNPTSRSHDQGEDARTESTTAFLHDGKWISIAISKTCTFNKIHTDSQACFNSGKRIDTLVFVTAGSPQTDRENKWRLSIKEEFGWDLVVHTILWLSETAAKPEYESLVDDHLHIPPLGGDYVDSIIDSFGKCTNNTIQKIKLKIHGIDETIYRDEVNHIEEQLKDGKVVLLTGEAGTGKSGIAAQLTGLYSSHGGATLLIDARDIASITTEIDLRGYLSLRGSVSSAIGRVGRYKGCRLIIDQLDNVIGRPVTQRVLELVRECHLNQGVQIIIVSRRREGYEAQLLNEFANLGSAEFQSRPLDDVQASSYLQRLGINQPKSQLVELARNLLNLEIIATIHSQNPSFNGDSIGDECDLWNMYREELSRREDHPIGSGKGEQVVAEAVRLAKKGLKNDDRNIILDLPPNWEQKRLLSSRVINPVRGRLVRFHHEKLQDYLYAWDATDQGYMPNDVVEEIGPFKTRNVLSWMAELYKRQDQTQYEAFLQEALNG